MRVSSVWRSWNTAGQASQNASCDDTHARTQDAQQRTYEESIRMRPFERLLTECTTGSQHGDGGGVLDCEGGAEVTERRQVISAQQRGVKGKHIRLGCLSAIQASHSRKKGSQRLECGSASQMVVALINLQMQSVS